MKLESAVLKQFIFAIILYISIFGLQSLSANAQKVDDLSANRNVVTQGVGISAVQVETSDIDEVLAKYGNNYKLEEHNKYSNQFIYRNMGLSFYYCAKDPEKKLFLIEVLKGSTDRGIVIGSSTLKDVINIYGEADRIENTSEPFIYSYPGIQFYFENTGPESHTTEEPSAADMKLVEIDVVPNNKSSNFCDKFSKLTPKKSIIKIQDK